MVGEGKKVLIVDDSPISRSIYKNRLVPMGVTVMEASNGIEAVKAIHGEKPDLIVLDLMMEGMDGITFLNILRSKEEWKDIKVIVLSGRIIPQETERILAFGVSAILPKMTTSPNKLADKVKETLEV